MSQKTKDARIREINRTAADMVAATREFAGAATADPWSVLPEYRDAVNSRHAQALERFDFLAARMRTLVSDHRLALAREAASRLFPGSR